MLTAHLLHARPEVLTSSTLLINCVSSAVPLPHRAIEVWLPGQDSNLDKRIQSPWCYHYTTRHLVVYYTTSGRVCCQRSTDLPTNTCRRTDYLLRLPIVTLFQRYANAAQLARRLGRDHVAGTFPSGACRNVQAVSCTLWNTCIVQLAVWTT